MRALFRKRTTKPNARPTSAYGDEVKPDKKDILAFVIAIYQLFLPLIIALVVVGAIVAVVLIYLR